MAYDENKARAMRGADPKGEEEETPEPEATGGEPSEKDLEACKRLGAALGIALTPEKCRAVCAAIKDLAGEGYDEEDEE